MGKECKCGDVIIPKGKKTPDECPRCAATKAWQRPSGWKPKHPCEECDGTGIGRTRTYRGDELVDWDDCRECSGTGEQPAGAPHAT